MTTRCHPWIGIVLVALTALFGAAPAMAHKVTVFAWIEGDTIYTESKFSAGKPVQGGTIEVFGPEGDKLLEGMTDDEGRFAFPIPQRTDLKVVLTAGMGHGNYWWVRSKEFQPPAEGAPASPQPVAMTGGPAADAPNASECLDARAVRQIIEEVIDSRLARIEARIPRQPPPWREIVAGIGYILGLVGVAVLVRNRKQHHDG